MFVSGMPVSPKMAFPNGDYYLKLSPLGYRAFLGSVGRENVVSDDLHFAVVRRINFLALKEVLHYE